MLAKRGRHVRNSPKINEIFMDDSKMKFRQLAEALEILSNVYVG